MIGIFRSIKGLIFVISAYYFFICLIKLINIIKNFRSASKEVTITENLKILSKEEFLEWTKVFLEKKGFEEIQYIGNNILKCKNKLKDYLVYFDNYIDILDEDYDKFLYGYMVALNCEGIALITIEDIDQGLKEFLKKVSVEEPYFYGRSELEIEYKTL